MKKIGIITYHRSINYGALLQAYALYTKIRSLGYDCRIIDYLSDPVEDDYRCRPRQRCFSWKNYFAHNLYCILHIKKKNKFIRFRKKIRMTPQTDAAGLDRIAEEFDSFITGSDQVFNPESNRGDLTFFLNFVKDGKPRNAYSASIGSIASFEKMYNQNIGELKRFSHISMRERNAAEYLSEKLNKTCLYTVDPVWLLGKEEWADFVSSYKEKEYILVYNLLDQRIMRDYVKHLSAETGLKVVVINGTMIGEIMYMGIGKDASNSGPDEFLSLISNAKCIITDSFHGTSFSIIFEKPFIAFPNMKNAMNTNSRLNSLLHECGLENRLFESNSEPAMFDNIDYTRVKEKMKANIEHSINYLKQICE